MHRCSYVNDIFVTNSGQGFRCDGKPQCWITDVGQFETTEEGTAYYCVFHEPLIMEPLNRDDWSIETRATVQADKLRHLLDEWNKENEQFVSTSLTCQPHLRRVENVSKSLCGFFIEVRSNRQNCGTYFYRGKDLNGKTFTQ